MLLGQQLLILLITRAPGEKNHKLLLSKIHFFLEGKVSIFVNPPNPRRNEKGGNPLPELQKLGNPENVASQ